MKRTITVTLWAMLLLVSCTSKSRIGATAGNKTGKTALQDSVVRLSRNYLNTPYRYGGNGPRGFDCSGFTSYVYQKFGYALPRSSRDQARQLPAVRKSDLQQGDLVFFEGRKRNGAVGHVGIVVRPKKRGEFDFIHAAVRSGVVISSSTEPYYASRYWGAGRVIARTAAPQTKRHTEKRLLPSPPPPSGNTDAGQLSDGLYHTVKRGETLSDIARMYDVPVSTLQYLNALTSKRIRRGQRLKVAEAAIACQRGTHQVQKGETLYSIARRYGCSVDELKRWNPGLSETIRPGDTINVNRED